MEKLKVESLVSAELRVSNADSESRTYEISAVVRVDDGAVKSVTNGIVKTKGGNDTPSIATFDSWDENNLNMQFMTAEGRDGILSNVEGFIQKCRTDEELSVMTTNL